jgi:pachytene checkpoint protein 2
MSGRALRRLPVLALAKHMGSGIAYFNPSVASRGSPDKIIANGHGTTKAHIINGDAHSPGGADVELWLEGMASVIEEQATEHERLL